MSLPVHARGRDGPALLCSYFDACVCCNLWPHPNRGFCHFDCNRTAVVFSTLEQIIVNYAKLNGWTRISKNASFFLLCCFVLCNWNAILQTTPFRMSLEVPDKKLWGEFFTLSNYLSASVSLRLWKLIPIPLGWRKWGKTILQFLTSKDPDI